MPLLVGVVVVGVGVAVGEVLAEPVLELALGVSVGEPLAEVEVEVEVEVEGVAVAGGWPALVVTGATGDEVASCGRCEALAVARSEVGHGAGAPFAAGVTAAAGVANGRADDIAEDLGFTTPVPGEALAEDLSTVLSCFTDAHPAPRLPPPLAAAGPPLAAWPAPSSDDSP